MSKQVFNLELLKRWIGGDPFREATLIKEAPIGKNTLRSLLYGTYKPSPRMVRALTAVMRDHPYQEKAVG